MTSTIICPEKPLAFLSMRPKKASCQPRQHDRLGVEDIPGIDETVYVPILLFGYILSCTALYYINQAFHVSKQCQ